MAWEENSCICLNMQLIAILSRIGVVYVTFYHFSCNISKIIITFAIRKRRQYTKLITIKTKRYEKDFTNNGCDDGNKQCDDGTEWDN